MHKLLKYKLRYDLQSKMSWHGDFSFKDNCFRYNLEEISPKSPIPKIKPSRVIISFLVQVL